MLDFVTSQQHQDKGWKAAISLGLVRRERRTVLAASSHYGPLRVQRPFYPEGSVCHVYLLHPPGGMVAGDDLAIDVDLSAGAEALLTTPAAGKFYRVAPYAPPQSQGVHAAVAAGATLEWLPQESIAFNGARGELRNRFELQGDAGLIGWDILCLGRRASGEQFETGRLVQRIEIYRNGAPLFIDRVVFEGGSEMLRSPWGMHGQSVSGTLFATLPPGLQTAVNVDELRNALPGGPEWGLSRRGDILLIRYLGHSAEACRRGFESIWQLLRPRLMQRPAVRPRIWNT